LNKQFLTAENGWSSRGFSEVLTIPHHRNITCFETKHKALVLDRTLELHFGVCIFTFAPKLDSRPSVSLAVVLHREFHNRAIYGKLHPEIKLSV